MKKRPEEGGRVHFFKRVSLLIGVSGYCGLEWPFQDLLTIKFHGAVEQQRRGGEGYLSLRNQRWLFKPQGPWWCKIFCAHAVSGEHRAELAVCSCCSQGLTLSLLLHPDFGTSPEMSQMCVLSLVFGSCLWLYRARPVYLVTGWNWGWGWAAGVGVWQPAYPETHEPDAVTPFSELKLTQSL